MSGALAAMLLASGKVEFLYDRTTGTNIGNMTVNGGLAAAFDGNTAQADAAACRGAGATDRYVGKTMAASHAISRVIVYPTTDNGYNGAIGLGSSAGDIRLYGKVGVPANATDGTLLGTATAVNNATSGSTTITSSDQITSYSNVWVNFNSTGAVPEISELQIYVF